MHEFQNEPALPGSESLEQIEDLEINDKVLAASGVLKTMSTLILSLESTPEILEQLENALLPVITFTLKNGIAGKGIKKD